MQVERIGPIPLCCHMTLARARFMSFEKRNGAPGFHVAFWLQKAVKSCGRLMELMNQS